jgi:hypothetical protein
MMREILQKSFHTSKMKKLVFLRYWLISLLTEDYTFSTNILKYFRKISTQPTSDYSKQNYTLIYVFLNINTWLLSLLIRSQ